MANIEENPTQEVEVTNMAEAADQATDSLKKTPGELINGHKAEVDKINEQVKKLTEEAKEHQAALEKIKISKLNLGTIRSERIGAIKGLQELVNNE